MSLEDELLQVWAQDETGRTLGPLSLAALKTMIESGELTLPLLYSYDGVQFEPAPDDLLAGGRPADEPEPPVLHEKPAAPTGTSAQKAPAHAPPAAAGKPAGPPPPGGKRAIQAAPPKGRMEQISGLRLYYLIAAADAGGLLTVDEGPNEVRLWFKQGTPQAAQSSSQGLGPFLVEHRALSKEALQEAMGQSGEDPVSFLFASGQLNAAAAFPLIQQHSLAVLQRALLLDKGPFTFDPEAPVPASGFPLGNRWEILAGAARRIDPLSLRRRLAGKEKQAPRLTGSTADLKLAALELRLVSALDGRRTLAELVAGPQAEAETQLRLIVLLQELDRLAWQAASGAPTPGPTAPSAGAPAPARAAAAPPAGAPTKPPAAARPGSSPTAGTRPGVATPGKPPTGTSPGRPAPAKAAPQQAPAGASPPGRVIRAEDPARFVAKLREKNYFERLGFKKSDKAPPDLKSIYLQYAKIYHPDMVASDAPPDEKKQRQDIQALLNEAYSVLSDEARRKNYLEELAAKEAGLDADALAGILKAEEDFTRAIILIKGSKIAEGLAMVEECIKLNAKEGEFYAWRGYAKFLLSTNKKAAFADSMKEVEKCLKMTPRCAPAYHIEGSMQKLIGEDDKAKKAFKKAVELDPKDLDAAREIRLFESRAGGKKK